MKSGAGPGTWAGSRSSSRCFGPLYFLSWAVRDRGFALRRPADLQGARAAWLLLDVRAASRSIAAAYWLVETAWRAARGRGGGNWREAAIFVATQGAFWFLANLDQLDVTFQAYNAWHSVQAFGIMWLAMNAKWRDGKIRGPQAVALLPRRRVRPRLPWAVLFSLAIGADGPPLHQLPLRRPPRQPLLLHLRRHRPPQPPRARLLALLRKAAFDCSAAATALVGGRGSRSFSAAASRRAERSSSLPRCCSAASSDCSSAGRKAPPSSHPLPRASTNRGRSRLSRTRTVQCTPGIRVSVQRPGDGADPRGRATRRRRASGAEVVERDLLAERHRARPSGPIGSTRSVEDSRRCLDAEEPRRPRVTRGNRRARTRRSTAPPRRAASRRDARRDPAHVAEEVSVARAGRPRPSPSSRRPPRRCRGRRLDRP